MRGERALGERGGRTREVRSRDELKHEMSTRGARARGEYEMITSVREARGKHEISTIARGAREDQEGITSARGARTGRNHEREGSASRKESRARGEREQEGITSARGTRGEREGSAREAWSPDELKYGMSTSEGNTSVRGV